MNCTRSPCREENSGRPANRGAPSSSAGPAQVQPSRPGGSSGSGGGGGGGPYYKDPKEWDGRSWPPPPYILCDVVAEVKSVSRQDEHVYLEFKC